MTPIVVMYQASLDEIFKKCPEKHKVIAKWNEEIRSRSNIKEEHKVSLLLFSSLIVTYCTGNRDPFRTRGIGTIINIVYNGNVCHDLC